VTRHLLVHLFGYDAIVFGVALISRDMNSRETQVPQQNLVEEAIFLV
jgi:hypothetical protein